MKEETLQLILHTQKEMNLRDYYEQLHTNTLHSLEKNAYIFRNI
jgi:hypothetical protein